MKSEDIQALLDAMNKESDGWYGSAQEAIIYLRQQLATLTAINKRLKEMIGLDCGDTACLYAVELTGMRTNGGCRCTPQPMPQLTAEREALKGGKESCLLELGEVKAERDASRELNRLNGIALSELNEQLTKAEQERDALKEESLNKLVDKQAELCRAHEEIASWRRTAEKLEQRLAQARQEIGNRAHWDQGLRKERDNLKQQLTEAQHDLAQARQRLSDQTDYCIKLARLIENIQYPNIDPPYEELHHCQMIKDAKQQLAEAQQREARLRGALSNLLAENEEYIKINHLLAMGNTDLVAAREALRETQP